MCVPGGKHWDVLTRSLRIFALAASLSLHIVGYASEFRRLDLFDQSASDLGFEYADTKHCWYTSNEPASGISELRHYVAALANLDLTCSGDSFLRAG